MEGNNVSATFKNSLVSFHDKIVDNPRVGPSHISLYTAILYHSDKHGFKFPISVFSRELMLNAKISGVATYTRCIQDLKEFGFIKYVPSYNPILGSLIYLLE